MPNVVYVVTVTRSSYDQRERPYTFVAGVFENKEDAETLKAEYYGMSAGTLSRYAYFPTITEALMNTRLSGLNHA